MVNSNPILITFAFAETLSHFYRNKTCTITIVYSDTEVGPVYVAVIQNPEDLSVQQVFNMAAVTWASVNILVKSYTRDVLKIEPASNESGHPIFHCYA